MTNENEQPKQLAIDEFVESGLLQEVNRQFFHPLGLALAVEVQDGKPVRLAYICDGRDDEEGFIFGDLDAARSALGKAVLAEQGRRLAIRHNRLGFGREPLP